MVSLVQVNRLRPDFCFGLPVELTELVEALLDLGSLHGDNGKAGRAYQPFPNLQCLLNLQRLRLILDNQNSQEIHRMKVHDKKFKKIYVIYVYIYLSLHEMREFIYM